MHCSNVVLARCRPSSQKFSACRWNNYVRALQPVSPILVGSREKHAAADRYEAVQAAAVEWLKDRPGPHQALARIVWRERFEQACPLTQASQMPEIGDWLDLPTFFTELRQRRNCARPFVAGADAW